MVVTITSIYNLTSQKNQQNLYIQPDLRQSPHSPYQATAAESDKPQI